MSRRLANIISLLFHPIFVPVFAVLAIVNYDFLIASRIAAHSKLFFTFAFIVSLSLLPLLFVMVTLKKYSISELREMSKQERSVSALSLSILYTAMAIWWFDGLFVGGMLRLFVVALAASSVVLAIVSRYIKVSFHVFGWAGIVVLMVALGQGNPGWFIFIAMLALVVAALVAVARLKLRAHTHTEVYLGFFLGLICNIAVYLLFNGRF